MDGGIEGSGKTPLSSPESRVCSWLIKAVRDLLCFFHFRFISADDKEGEEYSKYAATANKKNTENIRLISSFETNKCIERVDYLGDL